MHPIIRATFVVFALTSCAPRAGAQAMLSVGDCYGAPAATWTCTSNSGNAVRLVAYYTANVELQPVGHMAVLEFRFWNPLTNWWRTGTGNCRATEAMRVRYTDPAGSCLEVLGSGTATVSGWHQYLMGPLDPGSDEVGGPLDAYTSRLVVVTSVDPTAELLAPTPGDPVFVFDVTIDRSATDACAGCFEPACAFMRKVTVSQPAPLAPWSTTDTYGSIVHLQGGLPTCYVATSRSTWGQVKSLYR